MNKKFAAVTGLTSVLLLTMCSSIVVAEEKNTAQKTTPILIQNESNLIVFMQETHVETTMLENQVRLKELREERKRLKNKELRQNLSDLTVAIENTEQYVNKTWYVFSGSTPQGWDCSGLVRWTFAHMGFDLYHSATAQMENYGYKVSEPKYGDIVGFKYHGGSMYYHVGIYISDDLMLHSGGKKGDRTELRSISNFAGEHSKVSYSRLVDTN
jgi:cell wall-associated NlpC family hydrolase